MASKFPLVSVVIPMFNSAKFISQTLESLLYQTMKDFEVVVVDDCSTDNSVEVVESFSKRFNGRLHVVKLRENTGTPGIPRNVGIQFSRGKYIAFLDSDDFFTKTALAELTNLAEKYNADVISISGIFILRGGYPKNYDETIDMNALQATTNVVRWDPPGAPALTKPVIEGDLVKRVERWVKFGYRLGISSIFIRRDFLAINQIAFPNMAAAEDLVFTFNVLMNAKKLLDIPNVTYIVRHRAGSVSRENAQIDVPGYFRKWIGAMVTGTKELDGILSRIGLFKEHPNLRYSVIEFFFTQTLHMIPNIYAQIPAFKLNEIVKREFQPDDAPLAAYLFNTVNVYRLQIIKLQQELAALKNAQ